MGHPWEQRKLGSLVKLRAGNAWKSKDYTPDGKYLVVTIANVSGDRFITTETGNRIDCDNPDKFLLGRGDILISLTGNVGRVSKMKDCPAVLNQRVGKFEIKKPDLLDREFLFQLVHNIRFEKAMVEAGQGAAQKNISNDDVYKYPVKIPNIAEQHRISNFLGSIDSLITLHQRQLDLLKKQKKGLLQKLFPKEGSSIPELRFPGFTGPWEQRKLGDFYSFKNGLNKGKEYFGKGTPIVNFTDVFNNRGITSKMLKGQVEASPKEIKGLSVQKGDIFFTRTSETIEEVGYPSVMLDSPLNTVFSGFVLRGRIKDSVCDPLVDEFKQYAFFTNRFRNEMKKKSSMTTRALTSGSALSNMKFQFPKFKEEQKLISSLLMEMDKTITLHQRQIDLIKEQKKGLLQKMFPKDGENEPELRFPEFR